MNRTVRLLAGTSRVVRRASTSPLAATTQVGGAFVPVLVVVMVGDGCAEEAVGPFLGELAGVVANVVANALVHTNPDVPITMRLDSTDHTVVVEIIDTGQGLTPDVMSRVTDRFFRADPSRSRHRGGSGLGLAIVEATVTAHGGHVKIDRTPGRGTAIRLTFPAWPGTADTTAAPDDL